MAGLMSGGLACATQQQLLAGATGVISCYILHSLLQRPKVPEAYCLVRTKISVATSVRLEDVVDKNHLDGITSGWRGAISAVSYNINSHEWLGLVVRDYLGMETLRHPVTTASIIPPGLGCGFPYKIRRLRVKFQGNI